MINFEHCLFLFVNFSYDVRVTHTKFFYFLISVNLIDRLIDTKIDSKVKLMTLDGIYMYTINDFNDESGAMTSRFDFSVGKWVELMSSVKERALGGQNVLIIEMSNSAKWCPLQFLFDLCQLEIGRREFLLGAGNFS